MKTVIPLLEQLKSETIQERNDDKFIISVIYLKYYKFVNFYFSYN